MKFRSIILWLIAIVIVLGVNVSVFQRERVATTGRLVLLELAPVDPRSLIQGDYMLLRYDISRDVEQEIFEQNGTIVVSLDPNSIGRFVRFDTQGIPLAENEVRMKYFQRGYDVYIGPESFFFQEGHARYYSNARYGELRVSETGDVLLIGLRGEELQALGP
jgi:uncharacterized membrane-anchored protein